MTKYARQCSITGEGMNEGYLFQDTEYIKYEKDLLELIRSKEWTFESDRGSDVDVSDFNDDDLLEWAYNDEIYYWTQWDCIEDYEYEEIDGVLTEI
jgi:hypothetical protein